MAEEGNGGQAAEQKAPTLNIVAQYVKDLSFENPDAPAALQNRENAPAINIAVGVQARVLTETDNEVELKIEAKAEDAGKVVFAIELVYAGIFRMANIPPEQLQPLTLIECPRLLFPFARQIVAEASRNGGYPPLMIDPIDFVALYRQQAGGQGGPGQPPAGQA